MSFINANLTGADFSGADASNADFSNVNLNNANLTNAKFAGANLSNANLKGANLTGADFTGATLLNAEMDGAVIDGANFDSANLANANMDKTVKRGYVAARPALVPAENIVASLKPDPQNKEQKRKIDLTVNFNFNSDKLTADGKQQVNAIAQALKEPALTNSRILIEGHTDNIGSDGYNDKLSMRRATRVMKDLTEEYAVPAARLSAQGFGESKPIASNDSDLGRAMNRRVTLVNIGSITE